MKTYKIFTMKLARKLCLIGFKCIATEPNRNAPWLNVYLFEDSADFRDTLTKITK